MQPDRLLAEIAVRWCSLLKNTWVVNTIADDRVAGMSCALASGPFSILDLKRIDPTVILLLTCKCGKLSSRAALLSWADSSCL